MNTRVLRIALMLSALPLAGCGTAANLCNTHTEEGGRIPFGGVKHDLACLRGLSDGETAAPRGAAKAGVTDPYPRTALMLLCAVDLPLSAVADTVLWPYTCAYTVANQPVVYPAITIAGGPVGQPTVAPPAATLPVPSSPPPTTPPQPPPAPAPVPVTPPAPLKP